MHHIIYLSSASELFTDKQLHRLYVQCRKKNLLLNITGLLLYRDGNFLELIEGEYSAVAEMFQRVCQDCRNHGIIKVVDEPIPQREFLSWSMGFPSFSRLKPGSGIINLLDLPLDECPLGAFPAKLSAFMRPFLKRAEYSAQPGPSQPVRMLSQLAHILQPRQSSPLSQSNQQAA